MKDNLRKYGQSPYSVAVIHGGPGAPGEMAPVARELSFISGILEPLQTAVTIKGQIQELFYILQNNSNLPITLIGHSWGAWLSYLFTAQHPIFVKKLILVASGAFEERYVANLMEIRLNRLNKQQKARALFLIKALDNTDTKDKNSLMAEFGELMNKADSYNPIPFKKETIECQYEIYQKVWIEAAELRKNRQLLNSGKHMLCPVVVIHGDYDSTPYEGVRAPLAKIINNICFIMLDKCGHSPWNEIEARDRFYEIIRQELC